MCSLKLKRHSKPHKLQPNQIFRPNQNHLSQFPLEEIAISDFDLDGKSDLAVVCVVSNVVSILRNTSEYGVINTQSFSTQVDFATGNGPSSIAIGDLDADGKTDIAVTNFSSNTVSVFRNTSIPGNINSSSFAPKVDFATG